MVRLGDSNTSSERIIHFRQVVYNEQNHYSSQTGRFTCVIPGVYQFSFLCSSPAAATNVELKQNDRLVQRSVNIYRGGHHLSTGDAVLWLKTGDQMWLEAANGTTGLSPKSFFSGHLVFAVNTNTSSPA